MSLYVVSALLSVSSGRLFGLDTQTLISIGINLLNACILAAVLAKVLYNPVRNYLQKRAERVQNQLDSAANDMQRAQELKTQYEGKLITAETERNDILDTARKLADDKSRQVLSETRREADTIRERAAQDIQAQQERAREEMRRAIIEVSYAMANKVVAQAMDQQAQDKLFAMTVEELEELPWVN